MSTTINNTILSVTRRTKKGFTVGEIFDRVLNRYLNADTVPPPYGSVRARVYELARAGALSQAGTHKDPLSKRTAKTFVRK